MAKKTKKTKKNIKVAIKTESTGGKAKKAKAPYRKVREPQAAPKKGFHTYQPVSQDFGFIKVGEDTDNWYGLSVGRTKADGWISYATREDRDEMSAALVQCCQRVRDEAAEQAGREWRRRVRELEAELCEVRAQLAEATTGVVAKKGAPKPAPRRKSKGKRK